MDLPQPSSNRRPDLGGKRLQLMVGLLANGMPGEVGDLRHVALHPVGQVFVGVVRDQFLAFDHPVEVAELVGRDEADGGDAVHVATTTPWNFIEASTVHSPIALVMSSMFSL